MLTLMVIILLEAMPIQKGAAHALGQSITKAAQNETNGNAATPDKRFTIDIERNNTNVANSPEILLQVTVKNLTDNLLFLRTFRGREVDERIVLKQDSMALAQRLRSKDGIPSSGREGVAMVIKPHASTKELVSVTRLYNLTSGNYTVYVLERDPLTKNLVQSNTLVLNIQ
jgi:hypothetical protein